MNARRCEIALHLGRKGSGKSYRAKREVEKIATTEKVSVWDPRSEWSGPHAPDKPRNVNAAVIYDAECFLRVVAAGEGGSESVYVWQGGSFETFAKWCRRVGGLVVIDEAQLVAGHHSQTDAFVELVTTCRHSGASMLLCAQRAATLTPNLRAQVDRVRCWKTTEPRDLAWLAEAYGNTFAESLTSLEGHEFHEWNG